MIPDIDSPHIRIVAETKRVTGRDGHGPRIGPRSFDLYDLGVLRSALHPNPNVVPEALAVIIGLYFYTRCFKAYE